MYSSYVFGWPIQLCRQWTYVSLSIFLCFCDFDNTYRDHALQASNNKQDETDMHRIIAHV